MSTARPSIPLWMWFVLRMAFVLATTVTKGVSFKGFYPSNYQSFSTRYVWGVNQFREEKKESRRRRRRIWRRILCAIRKWNKSENTTLYILAMPLITQFKQWLLEHKKTLTLTISVCIFFIKPQLQLKQITYLDRPHTFRMSINRSTSLSLNFLQVVAVPANRCLPR